MYGCQQILIHPDDETRAILEYLCSEANKLTNCAIYYCRQLFFKAGRSVKKYALDAVMKENIHFKAMYASCAQQVCHEVAESFTSHKRLKKLWREGKLEQHPKLPNYRTKGGMAVASYPAKWVKQVEGNQLKIPLGRQVKAWFGITHLLLPMPSNLNYEDIKEWRIVPRNNCFYLECIYKQKEVQQVTPNLNVLGIDHGLDNWLTCVSTTGKSFILDGKMIKSQNQWYNKRVAQIKAGKAQDYWDEELSALTEKRNRQMRDNVNKAARFIINWCLHNEISTLVFGWNQRQKDSINLGKRNNQNFVQIPTARLKNRIAQLCEQYGIQFIETEESYTSKASFLDNDLLPTVGEKPDGWQPSGKRVKRGLYKDSRGQLINADCNGAANIIRKVIAQLKFTLVKASRGVLSLPQRYDLISLKKSYRRRAETGFYPA